ncbi:glycoside hydrolase family 127 protein [Actinocrinis puniceicyclus]|uniref:Glycoside hydrolase family 127 protein n=1 Tax=Actinocrinis puniceicyclus TaxID=977794 RepID=A0A8J7WV80_9ACTN|nr:beta-L-arabinofuranosidase domain-containing protein [Actinocrinis puniceicyclus]MBS2966435.1 glycoside hydrolase family 127 protein [Actinocrinis puniceicyclus]
MPRSSDSPPRTGPVRLGPTARTALRPTADAVVAAGFWAARQEVNARVGIPQGPFLLESAGNLHDLRLAAGEERGEFRGDYPFMDSDVYKWLEAASWQLGRLHPDSPEGRRLADDVERIIGLVAAAQQPDGYLNTWFQAGKGAGRYRDLRWGHELYCAGHLIQAAVAHHRATGRERLLDVARRFADHLDAHFGAPGSGKPIDGIDGHPQIETALVELYRETGERRYLELAGYFVDRHGHGLLGGEAYCQDRVPVREARTVEGHAVRQLYLLAAVADLATETGEAQLHAAGERLWSAMTATKTYLTGGVGAHHHGEEFGGPYELPAERAYCETCAAIASIQFSWRMALLTGDARYSDLIERTLFNGFLAGVSLDGQSWLYVNPLQVRDGHTDIGGDQSARRTRWFRCACCPPNVMRLMASLEHYFASTDGRGIQLHQFATGTFRGDASGAPVVVSVSTDYPWDGRIAVTVEETPTDREWTLALRVPQWCTSFSVQRRSTERRTGGGPDGVGDPGDPESRDVEPCDVEPCDVEPCDVDVEATADRDGWLRLARSWKPGDRVVFELDMEPRLTGADPRVDAVRGCVAIERGPLVYCVEGADHPGSGLDDLVLDTTRPLAVKHRPDLLGGVTTVLGSGLRRPSTAAGWWPYPSRSGDGGRVTDGATAGVPFDLVAVPYYAWANREDGAMRVWLPTS